AGAFVELEEGIDGFLHVDDLSWTRKIKHPGSELSVDQEIEVMVIEIDPDNRRIRVGVKQLSDDPWQNFAAANPPGTSVEGEITSITDFGVFLKVAGGIEGLINKQNLTESREETFEDAVKKYTVGETIKVVVVEVSPDKQKVAFSIKDYKKKVQREEISRYMSSEEEKNDGAYTLGDFLKNKNN
ncbi:MAG TPA: S1 RNA-binding domain-containing protein, partial [Treponemataceae bacterium]|nr:S1 RNA-binding domain-containing protein [Treponemataceae bacterium]